MSQERATEHDCPQATYRLFMWDDASRRYVRARVLGLEVEDFDTLEAIFEAMRNDVRAWEMRPENEKAGLYSEGGYYYIRAVF